MTLEYNILLTNIVWHVNFLLACFPEFLTPAYRFAKPIIVITGFNTDVEFDGVVYHVQTEDKGLETPFLLTLVYDGGTILASKRQPYDDLFAKGFDEKDLDVRLNRQHSLVCAAINAGRIDELIAMTRRESKETSKASPVETADGGIAKPIEEEEDLAPIPKPPSDILAVAATVHHGPVVDVISIIEDENEIELPEEAVESVGHMAGSDRPAHNRLCVGNAQILVKILVRTFGRRCFIPLQIKTGLQRWNLNCLTSPADAPRFLFARRVPVRRSSYAGRSHALDQFSFRFRFWENNSCGDRGSA